MEDLEAEVQENGQVGLEAEAEVAIPVVVVVPIMALVVVVVPLLMDQHYLLKVVFVQVMVR